MKLLASSFGISKIHFRQAGPRFQVPELAVPHNARRFLPLIKSRDGFFSLF